MPALEILFWTSLVILFYCYAGYGILLYLVNKIALFFKSSLPIAASGYTPSVTFIVAAYNEEVVLEEKIRNTLNLDYPADKLQMIFITDGSTDNSIDVVNKYPSIMLLHRVERSGKSAAIKRAMRFVETPLVIFSDANALLNKDCIKAIVKHFDDERVGGVAGEKKILNDHPSAVGAAEGLYWKYESFMKKQDADFNTVVGAAGELYSIRTELFQEFNDQVILDDFVISMSICLQGYRFNYEPGAYAIEAPSASLSDEQRRKIRISAGAYQSIGYLKEGLNIFKNPSLSFQYISRRLLRWVACPFLLVILFFTNILLVINGASANYSYFLVIQLAFYFLALCGCLFICRGWKNIILNVPFYFVFMNVCLVNGFFNYIKGSQTVLWKKSLREAME